MDSLRARRQTTILALVAIAISAGILSWSVIAVSRLDFASAKNALATSDLSTDAFVFPQARMRSNQAAKSDFGPKPDFAELDLFGPQVAAAMPPGTTERSFAGPGNDVAWLRARSLLAQSPGEEIKVAWPEPYRTAALPPTPAYAAPAYAAPAADEAAAPAAAPSRVAVAQPPAAEAAPVARAPETAAEPLRRERAETARSAAPRPHRVAARRTYVEKTVEQGDSGEVKFRLRQRACTPGNMMDVCYMPQANRKQIVIDRY